MSWSPVAKKSSSASNGINPGFVTGCRKMADKLRNNMDAGVQVIEADGGPFEEQMKRLTLTFQMQFAESERLERAIRENVKGLGYDL